MVEVRNEAVVFLRERIQAYLAKSVLGGLYTPVLVQTPEALEARVKQDVNAGKLSARYLFDSNSKEGSEEYDLLNNAYPLLSQFDQDLDTDVRMLGVTGTAHYLIDKSVAAGYPCMGKSEFGEVTFMEAWAEKSSKVSGAETGKYKHGVLMHIPHGRKPKEAAKLLLQVLWNGKAYTSASDIAQTIEWIADEKITLLVNQARFLSPDTEKQIPYNRWNDVRLQHGPIAGILYIAAYKPGITHDAQLDEARKLSS